MIKLYCLSGLGADKTVFKNLRIKGAELVHLEWVPISRTDTMESYADKMFALIEEDNPVIMGLSFGGMLASEIASKYPIKKAILISSAKDKKELRSWLWILKPFLSIIPPFAFKWPNRILYHFFGATTVDDKRSLDYVVKNTSGIFVKNALRAILNWRKVGYAANIAHIHGTDDKLIMTRHINATYWIENGGHLMIFNRAKEISHIIDEELKTL